MPSQFDPSKILICKNAISGCTCSGNYAFMVSHLKECTAFKECTDAKRCTSKECRDKGHDPFIEL